MGGSPVTPAPRSAPPSSGPPRSSDGDTRTCAVDFGNPPSSRPSGSLSGRIAVVKRGIVERTTGGTAETLWRSRPDCPDAGRPVSENRWISARGRAATRSAGALAVVGCRVTGISCGRYVVPTPPSSPDEAAGDDHHQPDGHQDPDQHRRSVGWAEPPVLAAAPRYHRLCVPVVANGPGRRPRGSADGCRRGNCGRARLRDPSPGRRWHTRRVARRRPSPATIAVLVVAHLVVTSVTWRDIRRRPADQIRGSKRLWRALSATNMSWSLAYLLFGRKRAVPLGAD